MKVVAITGKKNCEITNRPNPRIKGNYVCIKILAAPMCTEFHQYKDGQPSDCLGHEAAGEVVETSGPVKVKVGDRVVVMPQNGCGKCRLCLAGEHIHCAAPVNPLALCESETGRATYAEYCIQQDWLLLPIPDDISYDDASMACCGLGPTFNAMETMGVDAFDTVLISGLGPVGLGGAMNALCRGARVIGIESNPYRVELAKSIGVEAIVSPADQEALQKILALTDGQGADKSVETSSTQDAPAFLAEATRRKGQIASVGWGGPVNASRLVGKGLTVHGMWHWNHLRHAAKMMQTIRETRPFLAKTITHRFPLSKVKEAWEVQLTGQCGKIILHPWA